MSLKEYSHKRDFKKTPEPRGQSKKSGKGPRVFCVQEHHARHLHFDFRLELSGTLKSWAVPKGIPQKLHEKRLAIQVEDHPLDYANFEGVIPEGYGKGQVILWDYGFWQPTENPIEGIKNGRLNFELHGSRLSGQWSLVRIKPKTGKGAGKKQWLLIKQGREHIKKQIQELGFTRPQLAQLADAAPPGLNWIHEIKFDGYRSLAHKKLDKVQIFTRNGLDWTERYSRLLNDLKSLTAREAWIDGEITCVDDHGRSNFSLLQESLESGRSPLIYYVFDLLSLNNRDLRDLPLMARKQLLKDLIDRSKTDCLIYSEHWIAEGRDVLKTACDAGMEGIVSKQRDSPYSSGRSSAWIKVKCHQRQEFVIVGFTPGNKSRQSLGALLLGYYDKNKKLKYAGKVGTGFKTKDVHHLTQILSAIKTNRSPVQETDPQVLPADAIWIKPKFVAEVRFQEWTRSGVLRHPSYLGMRQDKSARQIIMEKPQSIRPKLSHPQKVLIPESSATKMDLAEYYQGIAKLIMPHINNRPLALLRCPDGANHDCFFQKHLQTKTQGLLTKDFLDPKGKKSSVIYLNSQEGLMSLVQLGALEIHAWGTHIENLLLPDNVVFDLDPGPGVHWEQVIEGARLIKEIASRLSLESFAKLTGGKGVHVHIPISPKYNWAQIKAFTKAIAQYVCQIKPGLFLLKMSKEKRVNKIFIDYLRNGFGATSIAPYSLRANSEGTIAAPVAWEELESVTPKSVTIQNYKTKLLKRETDPWRNYFYIKQSLSF